MAEVFKAKTVGVEGFEKIVAIKRILPAVAEDREFIGMFVDEAKITAALSHANLAQTFDLGRIDDTYYIAMEYVPGKDLRAIFERLKRRGEKLPPRLAAWAMSCVCEGLDYAHKKRDANGAELHIVHRDVSPQNVIVSFEGEVKLVDFGIAKAANKIAQTQAGILKGKFGYMSPEQVRAMPLDRRSDIFAAGVVLWELCTGERLFTGTSDFQVLEKVQQAKVPRPSEIEPAVPARLERAILRALTREPEDRYQQAGELAADLRLFLADAPALLAPREELARFMRVTFPDESAREHAAHEETRASGSPPGPATSAGTGTSTSAEPGTSTSAEPGTSTSAGPGAATAAGTGAAEPPAAAAGEPDPRGQPGAPAGPAGATGEPGPATARLPPRGVLGLLALKAGLAIGAGLALWAVVAAAHARKAAPAAPKPEAVREAAALGFLSLGSRPPAKVIIDGVDTGRTTPLPSWPLKAGDHRVRLVAGARNTELRVEIEAGRTVSEIVDLRGR